MTTAGRKLLSSLVYGQGLKTYIDMGLEPSMFRAGEMSLYSFMSEHIAKHGKIPSQSTIEQVSDLEDALVEAPEPPAFYLAAVEARYMDTRLRATIQEASAFLVTKDPQSALDALLKATSEMFQKKNKKSMFDFRGAEEIIFNAYLAQKTGIAAIPYGWPTLDEMSGGMRDGDLVTFVGRPSAGKTFQLLYTARNAWKTGSVPLFISMEMNPTVITQRLAAMQTHKKLRDLMKAELTTPAFKSMMSDLHDLKAGPLPFHVVDSNAVSTVEDVEMLCHLLKPSIVFVDGAYLLDHADKRLNRWDKQAESARLLKKRIATGVGVPCVASYQLSKKSAKDSKGQPKGSEATGMEDVHGSDEMAQLSTVMVGLFDNEKDIEAKVQRTLKILKGRNGESGEFTINWDFSAKMDFSEKVPEDPQSMQMDFLD